MNPNTRYHCVEALFNDAEIQALDVKRGAVGRSPFIRQLVHQANQSHGMPPSARKESRPCRGVGKPASRGRVNERRPF